MAIVAPPATPHRVDSDASTTATIAALLSCSNSRVMSGLKLVSDDCDQSMDDMRSPGSQSRMPTKLNPAPLKTLAWSPSVNSFIRFRMNSSISAISSKLTSASSSPCLGAWTAAPRSPIMRDLRSRHRHRIDDVVDDHVYGDAVARRVRTEPDAVRQHVTRQLLDVLGINVGAAVHEQCPHLDQPAPADRRAR